MFQIDKYRAAAKRHAWYDDDQEEDSPPNLNPFRKFRSRSRQPDDEENPTSRIQTNHSESYALQSAEAQRRRSNLQGIQIPKHAETMPSSSVPSSSKSPVAGMNGLNSDVKDMAVDPQQGIDNGREKEPSQDSATTSDKTVVESEVQKPRRRKFPFIGKKSKGDDGAEEMEKPHRESSFFKKDKQKFTAVGQLRATLLNSWINILLIFVPIGIAVNYAGIPKVGVFVINFIAIIPLAAMLSYATEEIALRVGETVGGLLNATFG